MIPPDPPPDPDATDTLVAILTSATGAGPADVRPILTSVCRFWQLGPDDLRTVVENTATAAKVSPFSVLQWLAQASLLARTTAGGDLLLTGGFAVARARGLAETPTPPALRTARGAWSVRRPRRLH